VCSECRDRRDRPKISSSNAAIPGITPVMTVGSKEQSVAGAADPQFGARGERLGNDPFAVRGLTFVDDRSNLHFFVTGIANDERLGFSRQGLDIGLTTPLVDEMAAGG
jgi:hypothetical protein